ncbi:hypothetical protein [Janthinobacterium sp. BJB301]|uniref:hypothetical protein n=1 Tax=Janthinobacterium sp. BJB301 TaxID=1560195 RepID=UPI00117A0DEF|nr:hypothetical protein [Janthinobacterium sp. BJB301]
MNDKSMILSAKVVESHLKMQFKDIGKYLDFFEKNIETEKQREAKAAKKYDDEMFQNIARYNSHVSFPAIHSNALLIFMHSSFERLFCLTACWLSISKDRGDKIMSLRDYMTSKEYLECVLAHGKPFKSPEWKTVEALRQVRNHLAHGGSENILGVGKKSPRLRAAKKINREAGEAFDITESNGTFAIEPNESAPRVAMACYRDFLFLLTKIAKDGGAKSAG